MALTRVADLYYLILVAVYALSYVYPLIVTMSLLFFHILTHGFLRSFCGYFFLGSSLRLVVYDSVPACLGI